MVLSAPLVIAAALAWLALLFAVAVHGERHGARYGRLWPAVYVLSLGVYCTAWTFYGTVTQATRWGAWLPPTFVGTIALLLFATPFLARLAAIAREENAATLADLVAARFGKDARLAAVITAVAVLGMVPYVALQLKAVAMSYAMLTGGAEQQPAWQDAAFWVALTMAGFAMLFGTRRAAATEHNRGLVLAIAFESLIKLGAMLAVGGFVVFGLHGGMDKLSGLAANLPQRGPDGAYLALIGLGVVAVFTLPHQFHVGIVELRERKHLNTARWAFPLFLVLIALPVLPIAWAGQLAFGARLPSDLYLLGLPLSQGQPSLALATFLGGVSAATGMVILTALTLSLMVANHWISPWLLHRATFRHADLRPLVLTQRRIGIVLVMTLAYLYSRAMGASEALADIGALSFSALAQLAPAAVAAVYRPGLPARAVLAGIVAGSLAWAWLLLAPVFEQAGLLAFGAWRESWWSPHAFLGLDALDPLARGTLVSLVLNVVVMLVAARAAGLAAPAHRDIAVGTLAGLAARFLLPAQIERLFGGLARADHASSELVERTERELAAVIGAASARVLVDAARRGAGAPLDSVAELVGEASQALRFNQRLLEAALENMSQGISVVDRELKLVAWNARYAELFGYPPELLRVGVPIAELVRYNLTRGFAGRGGLAEQVDKRVRHMRAGTPYVTERGFPDGAIVEIRGNPMPDGGFVATFTDVTAFRRAERELRGVNETLEQRVAERTAESERARATAERADRAKSRFLAAVSHDLLQPLNAAHLFTHALSQQLRHPQYREVVENIDGALGSAETLLASLLDISRLDAGGMPANVQNFRLDEMLQHLAAEFRVLAQERGLSLHCVASRAVVRSDPQLLRRVLQNFLANAIRYTGRGRILLGVRRRGATLALEVWDTGPGIAEADRRVIFEEFRRLDHGGQGLGLGLAIAERIARLLGHTLTLRSVPGRGSVFGIVVPRASAAPEQPVAERRQVPRTPRSRVLVVDNDTAVLRGMQTLLQGWQCEVLAARQGEAALRLAREARPDILLLDYHLDGGDTGLMLRQRLAADLGDLPCIIISADHGEALRQAVDAAGCHLLHKPLKPLALKSLMARLLAAGSRAA